MSDHVLDRPWSGLSLLAFVFPTMVMMVFMGLYTVVDTVFVARFVNTNALSAINMTCPVINVTVGLGTMIAAGGNAVISRKMGEGNLKEAREDFTFLILAGAAMGAGIFAAGTLWLDPIICALGASDLLFPYCKAYLGTLLWFIPANVVQTLFSNLFVTCGKPGMGFGLSVLAGIVNIVLDYVFIVTCDLGICGAALGTGCGYLIPVIAGCVFFLRSKNPLSFTAPRWKWPVLRESCLNGSSEMVGQLSSAVTTFLFNRAMMNLLGEDGVAAITIIIYSQFLLNTLYIGFSMGAAPIIGFNYGSKNIRRQRKVIWTCVGFIMAVSLAVFGLSITGGPRIAALFAPDSSPVYAIAAEGFSVFSYGFLFCGLNLFTSSMFTALSDGRTSAVLSFLRTFVLLAGNILLLPRFFGVTGVWLAVPAAEGIMFCLSLACLFRYRDKYFY